MHSSEQKKNRFHFSFALQFIFQWLLGSSVQNIALQPDSAAVFSELDCDTSREPQREAGGLSAVLFYGRASLAPHKVYIELPGE